MCPEAPDRPKAYAEESTSCWRPPEPSSPHHPPTQRPWRTTGRRVSPTRQPTWRAAAPTTRGFFGSSASPPPTLRQVTARNHLPHLDRAGACPPPRFALRRDHHTGTPVSRDGDDLRKPFRRNACVRRRLCAERAGQIRHFQMVPPRRVYGT